MQNALQLSMLRLTEDEQRRMSVDFEAIVHFAGELGWIDAAAPQEARAVPLREDIPGESLPLEDVVRNAKTVSGRMIAVPKTFE